MKAGLVTFYHIHHYGALLQAAATERAVERFGWDCEIIDYFVNQDNALFKRPTGLGSAAHDAHTALHYQALSERYRRFEKFSRDHLRISDRRYGRFDELAGGPLPYDLILSGSDQIWNPKIFPDGRFDPVFFGTFSQKRRIAYAPSFGVPTIPEGMQAELKGYLDGFSHLSARETSGERHHPGHRREGRPGGAGPHAAADGGRSGPPWPITRPTYPKPAATSSATASAAPAR